MSDATAQEVTRGGCGCEVADDPIVVSIDGQSLSDFASKLNVNLELLLNELREKRYQPLPVRRVEIPKEDGGTRLLGIPAVRDRVVQQVLLDILNPIFDPDFHPPVMGIVRVAVVIKPFPRRHALSVSIIGVGWSTWICRSASICSIMS